MLERGEENEAGKGEESEKERGIKGDRNALVRRGEESEEERGTGEEKELVAASKGVQIKHNMEANPRCWSLRRC